MPIYEQLAHITSDAEAGHNLDAERWGIDPDGLERWCLEDAVDTIRTVMPLEGIGPVLSTEQLAALLAMQTHSGILLGVRLAREGRV